MNLDPEGNEYITEMEFRKIMRGKNGVPEEDVQEMIEEYKSLNTQSEDTGSVIFYKGLSTFLSNLVLCNLFRLYCHAPGIASFSRGDCLKKINL